MSKEVDLGSGVVFVPSFRGRWMLRLKSKLIHPKNQIRKTWFCDSPWCWENVPKIFSQTAGFFIMIYHGTIRKTSPKRQILPENGVDSKNDKTSKPMVFWGSRKTTPCYKTGSKLLHWKFPTRQWVQWDSFHVDLPQKTQPYLDVQGS